ncbi:hypothetical protein [Treponema bryantii]|uniref:hypothetical protein n=1 Tax=Treponema bryantii TaxID=163 RepID=UPI001160CFBC|nr:hypothetical protein [Treponema bryantii]
MFLGMLVGALVIGLASCKQAEGPQDVNIVDYYKSSASYECTATGTYNYAGSQYTVDYAFVEVSWNYHKDTDTNTDKYTISGYLYGKTDGSTSYSEIYFSKTFYKKDGKWCITILNTDNGLELHDVSAHFTGSPTDSTFSYKVDTSDIYESAMDLTFTRL